MIIKINTAFPSNDLTHFDFEGSSFSYFILGNCYLEDEKEIIKAVIKEDTNYLSKLVGDFTLVLYDQKKQAVKITSDRPGKHNVFYHVRNKECIISDDFWDMKEELSFGLEDIDVLALKQQVMFFTCLSNKTILKNVKTVPAASIVKIDLVKNKESISRYWSFSYQNNTLSHDDKLDLIDNAFDTSLNTIKAINADDTTFAIGVSGGLDSRLIPYYALKNNMDIEGFTVGLERPRKVFISNDFNSANKIANYFGISRKTLRYDSLSFEQQLALETELAPEIGSQVFKIVSPDNLKSKVLLTGASGFVVGASPMYSSIKNNDLIEHTLLYQSLLTQKPPGAKFKKALNYFTGLPLHFKPTVRTEGLGTFFTQEDLDTSIDEIKTFYSSFSHLSCSEKLMNYAIFGLGRNNAKGAFESFLGQMKSFSIYTPFFLDVVSQFNEDELLNRKLFQQFISERLPQLSEMQGQDFKPTMSSSNNRFNKAIKKISAMGNFVIRGSGVMNYENWIYSSEFIQLQRKVEDKSHFITEELGINFDIGEGNFHPAVKQNILKMKNVLSKF